MTSDHMSAALYERLTRRCAALPRPRHRRGAPLAQRVRNVAVVPVGFATVLLGLVLVPLPGPGWLTVFAGLSMLSGRFVWARRARTALEGRLKGFARWFGHLRLLQRAFLSLLSTLLAATGTWAWFAVAGLPTWLPQSWTSVLEVVPGW